MADSSFSVNDIVTQVLKKLKIIDLGDGTYASAQSLATGIAGEDLNNDVMKVESRSTPIRCTADTLVKTGPGYLKSIRVTQPASATPTAGVVTIYDNTAESGTILWQHYFPAAALGAPVSIPFEGPFTTGLYIGFDGTLAGLVFGLSYR